MKYLKLFEGLPYQTIGLFIYREMEDKFPWNMKHKKIVIKFTNFGFTTESVLAACSKLIFYNDHYRNTKVTLGGSQYPIDFDENKDLRDIRITEYDKSKAEEDLRTKLENYIYDLTGNEIFWGILGKYDDWSTVKDKLVDDFFPKIVDALRESKKFGNLLDKLRAIQKQLMNSKYLDSVKKRHAEKRFDL